MKNQYKKKMERRRSIEVLSATCGEIDSPKTATKPLGWWFRKGRWAWVEYNRTIGRRLKARTPTIEDQLS